MFPNHKGGNRKSVDLNFGMRVRSLNTDFKAEASNAANKGHSKSINNNNNNNNRVRRISGRGVDYHRYIMFT